MKDKHRINVCYVLSIVLFFTVLLIFGVTGSWSLVLNLEIAFILAAVTVPIVLWLMDYKIPEWVDTLRRRSR